MRIGFPVLKAEGLESEVYGHFGSAPVFVVFETENGDIKTINNKDQHHAHGSCNPMKALDNEKVDAIVVGGIGGGALTRLNQLGIKVFRATAPTIKGNIDLLRASNLSELTLQQCCGGHSNISGCAHH